MTRQLKRLACLAALLALFAGCGSSPRDSYYLLTAPAGTAPTAHSPAVGVGPVSLPDYLTGDRVVYGLNGNAMTVGGSHKWAEPLEGGIQRVLAINLASLLNTQSVVLFPWESRLAPDYTVRARLLALDTVGTQAVMTVQWSVERTATGAPVRAQLSRLQAGLEAQGDYGEQVARAYSALVLELAELMATAVRANMAAAAASAPL